MCLLCFNTGCCVPTGEKSPTIDKWIEMHPGTLLPEKTIEIVDGNAHLATSRRRGG
jgi:hypothetical protein